MRQPGPALLTAALLLTACRTTPAPASPPGIFRFEPKAEETRVGPVGTGLFRCELYVYAWSAKLGRCRVQVNHCSLERAGSTQVVCLSLADERTLACGARADACGQQIECVCPRGAAAPVPDAPGMVHLTPTGLGQTVRGAKCTARVVEPPGKGPPPAPCVLSVEERGVEGEPVKRTQMLSCGVRSTVCGRPVRCDCPGAPKSTE